MPRWQRGTTIVCCSARMDPCGRWVEMTVDNWAMEASSNGDWSGGGNSMGMRPTVRAMEMTARSTEPPLPPTATERQTAAYSFDGVNDYIETPSVIWGFDNTLSVSVWIKNEFNSAFVAPLSLGRTHMSDEILLSFSDNNSIEFFSHKSANNYAVKGISLISQDWVNLVGVYNGGFSSDEILVYLNGEQQTTSYLTSGVPSLLSDITPRMLRIGARVASPISQFFNGSIDDIRIYNRALSESEVSALYTLESSPPSYEPVKIEDENVTAIASGSETSYFIKNDGSLWGMGRNDRGQLGNAQGLDQGLVGWWKLTGMPLTARAMETMAPSTEPPLLPTATDRQTKHTALMG